MPGVPRNSTICITGAGGYVGGWIVKVLLDRGHRVRACVRDAASDRNDFLRNMLGYSTGRLTLHSCDVAKDNLGEILSGCHGLIHAAADPDMPLEKRPQEYCCSSQNVIHGVGSTSSIMRLIFVSSAAAIMGDTDIRELSLRPSIDEGRFPNLQNNHCVNGYVEGKLQSERLFLEAARASQGRWDLVITNPGDNIGPVLSKSHVSLRRAWTPWHSIIAQIMSDGTFPQSYGYRPWWVVDVRDTADIHARLLESNTAGQGESLESKRFFLCSTDTIEVEHIGAAIARLIPEMGFDINGLSASSSSNQDALLMKLGMTEDEVRQVWAKCDLSNKKVCAAVEASFRPLDDSLRDCVESLVAVAKVKPRVMKEASDKKRQRITHGLDAPVVRAATAKEIPVIDVSNLLSDRRDAVDCLAAQIKQACLGTGFFYVSNHGLEHYLAVLLKAMRCYFASPEKDKLLSSIDRYQRGFRGYGHDQTPGRSPDCKESFDIGVDLPHTHPAVVAGLPMHGPNQWPSYCPELQASAENFFTACEHLGRKLLGCIASSLGLPQGFFDPHCSEAMVQMRMFHYPPPPGGAGYGSSPHTDYGMITLLAQDPIGGLEVQTLSGEWVSAPYIEGTLVINIGDMLARWTNDTYHSTLHRVINRAQKDRYSVAMFYHLNADSLVTPLASCTGDDKPSKYEPIKYLSHIVSRFEEVLKAKF